MSRLYIINSSDMSKTGKRANEIASSQIYWGSVGDSKLAGSVHVFWEKGKDSPTVSFVKGEEISELDEEISN